MVGGSLRCSRLTVDPCGGRLFRERFRRPDVIDPPAEVVLERAADAVVPERVLPWFVRVMAAEDVDEPPSLIRASAARASG